MPAPEIDHPLPPTVAERALLRAFLAFGNGPSGATWARLSDRWRARLDSIRGAITNTPDPASARDRLERNHHDEARPDPTRIHPTWWARALSRESPSVRRAVISHAPDPIGPALRRTFAAEADATEDANPPDPDALAWVLALAGERFVGGPAREDDDPPIIRIIAALDGRRYSHLVTGLGLARLAFLGQEDASRPRNRDRIAMLRPSLPEPTPELLTLVRDDLAALHLDAEGGTVRNLPPRLGLRSVARLLAPVDPHRTRWALQHLPYPIARSLYEHMSHDQPSLAPALLQRFESDMLLSAVVLLVREGRVDPLILDEPASGPGEPS